MISKERNSIDAIYLGICSIATQAVFLRFILSSQAGGEFYAAFALGGWIVWVGAGAVVKPRFGQGEGRVLWPIMAFVKLPIAFLIFDYPAFFTGVLDPVKFLPLAFFGMAPTAVLYGNMFARLAAGSKASAVYRNEAVGSVIGGLIAGAWVLLGGGDMGLLILIAFLEISRYRFRPVTVAILTVFGVITAVLAGPSLDLLVSDLRWRGFEAKQVSVGLSGRWTLLQRGDQMTLAHNGTQVGSFPDRASSEDALLWPFLFDPDAVRILLIGYEGIPVENYLPEGTEYLCLYGDGAVADLRIGFSNRYETGDPLEFHPRRSFDIVSINLHASGNLTEYRRETDLFFRKCKSFLADGGILFVSAPSDENYISAPLAEYLTSLFSTLKREFADVSIIPGMRAGFVCSLDSLVAGRHSDPVTALGLLNLDSPYFNLPLIVNRLSPYRVENFTRELGSESDINRIEKPESVLRFLKWQRMIFGGSGLFFDLYRIPYLPITVIVLLLIPLIVSLRNRKNAGAVTGVMIFGFAGISFEIAVIYLFSTLFGSLYLHLGLLVAVFMAGLALGAGTAARIRPVAFPLVCAGTAILLILTPSIYHSILGLKAAFILLYIISASGGFATGGVFAVFADLHRAQVRMGAILYGVDLYGAMTGALFIPGILMLAGIKWVAAVAGIVGLAVTATFRGKRE